MNLVENPAARLQFYATPAHACSYLPDREAINAFADPHAIMCMALYAKLLDHGFRRSGKHVYKPHCTDCKACVATRIPVWYFTPNRSQKRNWDRNADLEVEVCGPEYRDEDFALYRKYINARHAGGDMENPSAEAYRAFLIAPWADTKFISFRHCGRLLCIAVVDQISNGLSAVYSFFDPDEHKRGLGTYAVLWQIAHARSRHQAYVYLGYWISNHRKMSYKIRFQPMEGLINNRWTNLPPSST